MILIFLLSWFIGAAAQVRVDTVITRAEVQDSTIRIDLQIHVGWAAAPDTTQPAPPDTTPPPPQPPDSADTAGTITLTLERRSEDVAWLSAVNYSDRILSGLILKNLFFDYVRCDDFRNRVTPPLGYTGDGRITADSVTVEFIDPVERGDRCGIGIVFTGGIVDEFDVILLFGDDRVPVNIGMLKQAEVDVPVREEPEGPRKIGIRIGWDRNTEPDLAGYIVKYGMARGSVAGSRHVDDPNTTYYDMEIFAGLTYWFCLQAFDRSGNVSRESEWVSFRE
jgi:hypothetical protein